MLAQFTTGASAGKPSPPGTPRARQQQGSTVTREQKLALIIGFSLILAVGVLISDHLSRARTDTIIADTDIDQPMVVHRLAAVPPGIGESGLPHAGRDAVLAEAPSVSQANPIRESLPGLGAQPQSDPVTIADLAPRESAEIRPGLSTPTDQPVESAPLEVRLTSSSTRPLELPGFEPVTGYSRPVIDDSAPVENASVSRPPTVISAVQQTPPPQKQVTHVVAEGETLYGIAARYYGNGDLWPELLKANTQAADSEGRVFEGARLVIPQRGGTAVAQVPQQARTAPQPAQTKPATNPTAPTNASGGYGFYTIKPGDTLSEISQELMGTMRRMNELIELNRDQIRDADDIRVGMKLRYPRGQRA